MRLTLVRHGQTVENVKGICQGQLDGNPTALGRKQGSLLSERLRAEKFNHIYSSDLGRARDLAYAIHLYHQKTYLEFTKMLRERYLGELHGKPLPKDWKNLPTDMVESHASMTQRTLSVLEEAITKYENGHVLFIGHGGTNLALIAGIKGTSLEQELDVEGMPQNTSVYLFDLKRKADGKYEYKILKRNCTEHLKAIEQQQPQQSSIRLASSQ